MNALGWPLLPTPDLTGELIVLTGGSDGLGREAALQLACWGARLILPVRSQGKGERVAARITQETGRRDATTLIPMDLADLSSVRAGSDRIRDLAGDRLVDRLVSVAGTVTRHRRSTVDGFEQMVAVNALAPMVLTERLLPIIRERVVVVASHAHTFGRVDPDDLHFRDGSWSLRAGYGGSKLLTMLWGLELTDRLRERDARPDLQLVHPGWVLTNLQNASGSARVDRLVTAASRPFAMSAQRGAQSVLFAATQPLPHGSYIGPDGAGALRGRPTFLQRTETASDRELAHRTAARMREEVGLGDPFPLDFPSSPHSPRGVRQTEESSTEPCGYPPCPSE